MRAACAGMTYESGLRWNDEMRAAYAGMTGGRFLPAPDLLFPPPLAGWGRGRELKREWVNSDREGIKSSPIGDLMTSLLSAWKY